jgi:hypothetical protein
MDLPAMAHKIGRIRNGFEWITNSSERSWKTPTNLRRFENNHNRNRYDYKRDQKVNKKIALTPDDFRGSVIVIRLISIVIGTRPIVIGTIIVRMKVILPKP